MPTSLKQLPATALSTLLAVVHFLWNKAFMVMFLGYGTYRYMRMLEWIEAHPAPEDQLPFVDIFYSALMIGWIAVLAPLLRLLIFPEAAEYAETGKLRRDIGSMQFRPSLVHYWYATALCFAVAILCVTAFAAH